VKKFQFRASVLSGQKEQTPRWQRMSGLLDNQMGDLLGELYVQNILNQKQKPGCLNS
jgi:putative endopeptidase